MISIVFKVSHFGHAFASKCTRHCLCISRYLRSEHDANKLNETKRAVPPLLLSSAFDSADSPSATPLKRSNGKCEFNRTDSKRGFVCRRSAKDFVNSPL